MISRGVELEKPMDKKKNLYEIVTLLLITVLLLPKQLGQGSIVYELGEDGEPVPSFTKEDLNRPEIRIAVLTGSELYTAAEENFPLASRVQYNTFASWTINPNPEEFIDRVINLSGKEYLRAVFAEQNVMIDYDHNDTHITVYDPGFVLMGMIRTFASAKGFFVWGPPQKDNLRSKDDDSTVNGHAVSDSMAARCSPLRRRFPALSPFPCQYGIWLPSAGSCDYSLRNGASFSWLVHAPAA